jgi:hypothetical protein
MDLLERLMSKVSPEPNSGCWLWTALCSAWGYGRISKAGVTQYAHRLSWELHRGPITDGLFVLHRCDQPACVNPVHLFLGTAGDNARDMAAKGRQVFQRHPGKAASGERHGSRTRPERVPRGDRHGHRTKPERIPRGEKHGRAKLTTSQVVEIRRLWDSGAAKQSTLAQRFGVSKVMVGLIVHRRSWKHVA